jgi:hypothetical protein
VCRRLPSWPPYVFDHPRTHPPATPKNVADAPRTSGGYRAAASSAVTVDTAIEPMESCWKISAKRFTPWTKKPGKWQREEQGASALPVPGRSLLKAVGAPAQVLDATKRDMHHGQKAIGLLECMSSYMYRAC